MINRFTDDYAFLNNFWSCPVSYDQMSFLNVGQAFVASKTSDRQERTSIARIGTAREVMVYANKMPHRELEEDLRVMEYLLRQKFEYPVLREKLLATGTQELIDGRDWISNPYDLIWSYDLKRLKGDNHHGKLLMKIRSEL